MRLLQVLGLGFIFALICPLVQDSEGARILTIAFMSSRSHKITYEPLLRQLARRGHEVTILSPILSKDEKNFKNIPMTDPEEIYKKGPNLFEVRLWIPPLVQRLLSPMLFMGPFMRDLCVQSYELPQVKEVLEERWDLIFFTPLGNECLWGLIHKLNATTVIYQQTQVFPWIADKLGSPSPPSFVSSLLIGLPDRMTFGERLFNFVRTVFDWAFLEFYYIPLMEGVYRKALNDPNLPPVAEILRNTSIVLTNSHVSFSKPRPLLPDIIEVGGMHLVPAKPVPKDLNDFLSGGKDGFILFSMGSALKGSMMPENYRKLFLNVFSKLEQRVIWKWETETMDDLPVNVKLSKWLPQQDVLGHKDIRLFITHGGLGSTNEALYHGVPLVGIPILADQPSNMEKAAELGFSPPPLEFNTLTEEILLDAINEALSNPKYRETAKRLSAIFLDQDTTPMDRAIYWVEYVIRHQGATHLRSAARDLNYIQYFSLDVLALIFIILGVSFKVNIWIWRAVFRRWFPSKRAAAPGDKQKKQ